MATDETSTKETFSRKETDTSFKVELERVGSQETHSLLNGQAQLKIKKRLQKYTAAELITVKNGTQDEEGDRLLKGSERSYRIVFDERGESLDTQQLTRKIDGLEMDGGCSKRGLGKRVIKYFRKFHKGF